jgi:hypothetical protein
MNKHEYLTEGQVALMIKRAVQTLRNDRYLRRGLPYVKFGKSVRYSATDVENFMNSHKINPADDI